MLSQVQADGKEEIIYTFSKGLDKAQRNYSITDKESLAVIKSLEHFRCYLIGENFTLKTVHKALEYLWSTNNTNSRMLRWALKIQDYNFTPVYIKGEGNIENGLSRQNIISTLTEGKRKVEAGTKEKLLNSILNQYHIFSGHGASKTMKFMLNGKYY